MAGRMRLAVLISGRGSNMQALIEACAAPDYPAEIAAVIANRPEAAGLARAREAGIPAAVVDHTAFTGKAAFEAALQAEIAASGANMICLAGFMRLLSAEFVEKWPDRILNIHPSLLPAYKGLDTHARALADGAAETGCTVHIVRPEMDAGPVILQRRVPVLPGDTAESLAARVLAQEHIAYPEAVRLIAEGRVRVHNERVEILERIALSKG
jgi:phosphoribosylglycinamide formyltransferase-1